jgi:hypothetical protein
LGARSRTNEGVTQCCRDSRNKRLVNVVGKDHTISVDYLNPGLFEELGKSWMNLLDSVSFRVILVRHAHP